MEIYERNCKYCIHEHTCIIIGDFLNLVNEIDIKQIKTEAKTEYEIIASICKNFFSTKKLMDLMDGKR